MEDRGGGKREANNEDWKTRNENTAAGVSIGDGGYFPTGVMIGEVHVFGVTMAGKSSGGFWERGAGGMLVL